MLAREDSDLFFKLMWHLHHYVNEQLHILDEIGSLEEYAQLPTSEKVQVRDALWENPALIDAYVKDNPAGLTTEELDIIRNWKRFVSGTFQIFRQLKKHAIFIGPDSRVYAVLGLRDSLEEIFSGWPLPIMVEAVLLPFKGKITYDGLFKRYNIYFGGGMKASMKEEYLTAKQQGRIITSLEPELAVPAREARQKLDHDWRTAVDEMVKLTDGMKGGPAVQNAAFALLRSSARLSQAVVHRPAELNEFWQLEREVRRALTRLQTTLERAAR